MTYELTQGQVMVLVLCLVGFCFAAYSAGKYQGQINTEREYRKIGTKVLRDMRFKCCEHCLLPTGEYNDRHYHREDRTLILDDHEHPCNEPACNTGRMFSNLPF